MRFPSLLDSIPRQPLVIAIPIVSFLIMAGVGFGAGQVINSDSASAPLPTPTTAPAVVAPQATSTATVVPTVEPTATVLPDRTDCAEIAGTDYRSAAERDYYLENCTAGGDVGGQQVVVNPPPSSAPAPSTSGAAGAQVPLGERLVIPAIGVNAEVYGTSVGLDGVMPDPYGYFNVVRYNFDYHAGLGGTPQSGNLVLAGHVDSAVYGAVVFYNLTQLGAGDIIEYYTADGQVIRYEVFGSGSYLPSDNWAGIVAAGTADITLITCTGSFNTSIAGEYSHRQAVFGRRL